MNILKQISDIGVLPVIKIERLSDAVPLAQALRKGGINAIEVTVRNNVAYSAIQVIHETFPDMIVGAGTILNIEMVDCAIQAGAAYIVSPGFEPEMVAHCQERSIPVVPGCTTATEITAAVRMGLKVLKFFPAELNGGLSAIKLLAGPFASVRFISTGGIDYTNLEMYLRCDAVAACGGSFMAKADWIRAGDWERITAACREAIVCSLGFELAHVGMNHDFADEAYASAEAMARLFSLGIKDGNSSLFVGKAVEMMKNRYYGCKGHVGFYTNSVVRALAWFHANDIPIREESFRKDEKGNLVSFYLQEEIGGFAIHVVRR